ncbi:Circulating cathodic antigen [Schistosoma japonicum]|uniref:Circulating cathodic antigen n=1 Tax=Schistosoma japonicum TaxID=6182 RepID=A0A4Z2DW08_SCHJA|nr:Circulating cathodic antigen [Schistosoma japonicum]
MTAFTTLRKTFDSMLKYGFDKVMDDVQLLVTRLRAREESVDVLRQQLCKLQAQLQSMQQRQETILEFDEFCKRVSNQPKGPLIICLAAENKQLEQLRIENKTLRSSLDEHQTALDMIMTKYRGQISKLMRTYQVEHFVHSVMSPDNNENQHLKSTYPDLTVVDTHSVNSTDSQPISRKTNSNRNSGKIEDSTDKLAQSLTEQLTAVASIVREVTDQGDVYAAELEEELHRLRSENAGLRELLMISSDCCPDNTPGDSVYLPPVSLPSKDSIHHESSSSLSGQSGRFHFLDDDSGSIHLPGIDECLDNVDVNENSFLYNIPSADESSSSDTIGGVHSDEDSDEEDSTVHGGDALQVVRFE